MAAGDSFMMAGAFLAGIILGGVFFGGLWLTIRQKLSSAAVGLWLMGSFMLRTAVVLLGFYLVFAGDWRRLIACLAGFVLARFALDRFLRLGSAEHRAAVSDRPHAP